ncbi:MAG: hypothetical protein R3E58_12945 [Phycisphaerae bacterium]
MRLTKKGQIEASRIVLSRRDAVAGRTEGVSEASDDEAKASELVAILNTLCVQLNRAMELLVGKSRLHAFWFSADKYSIEKAARLLERLGARRTRGTAQSVSRVAWELQRLVHCTLLTKRFFGAYLLRCRYQKRSMTRCAKAD